MAIYETIAREKADTLEGAAATDAVIELTGQRLFPERSYRCSAEAVGEYAAAERLYDTQQHEAALDVYRKALDLCPGNAMWWIHAGDGYFGSGDFAGARDLYLRGLAIDPWNRGGHRFLADAEIRLGNSRAAYRSAVMSVVSDPTYHAGWQLLKDLSLQLGAAWNRRDYEYKPRVAERDGKPTIALSPAYESQASLTAWLAYGMFRSVMTFRKGGKDLDDEEPSRSLPSHDEWQALNALERERLLIEEALTMYSKYSDEHPGTEAVFWETMKRARALGFTDEAIYMNLMDAELATSYVAYREANHERLAEYVMTIIAPLSGPGRQEARSHRWTAGALSRRHRRHAD